MIVIGIIATAVSYYGKEIIHGNGEVSNFSKISIGNSLALAADNGKKIAEAEYGGAIESATEDEYLSALTRRHSTINKYGTGRLTIPSANISLPILAGSSSDVLFNGVGTYRDRKLGEGNFIAFSHNVRGGRSALLNNLSSARVNEDIFATDFENVYQFRIYFSAVVNEAEGNLLNNEQKDGLPIITVFRCEGGAGTDWRYLVQGELVGVSSLEDTKVEVLETLSVEKSEEVASPEDVYSDDDELDQVSVSALEDASIALASQTNSDYFGMVVIVYMAIVLMLIVVYIRL